MIKLVETYFRGKKKSQINEEMQDFCKEHNLQERDVRTIISKMHLPKRRKQPGFNTKYPPQRKSKVTAKAEANQTLLTTLTPKKEKERYHPPTRVRTWKFDKGTNKWISTVVPNPDWVRPTRWLKSSPPLPQTVKIP